MDSALLPCLVITITTAQWTPPTTSVWRKSDGTQSGYNTWRANFVATATGTTNSVGLTKLGAGTLELTGTNTYTGTTTIGAGTFDGVTANQSVLLTGSSTALDPNTLVTFASSTNPENRWELHDSVGNPFDATVRGISGGGLNSVQVQRSWTPRISFSD